jgi:ubiquinol-cytochrome c reductase iron-sulfur subunit
VSKNQGARRPARIIVLALATSIAGSAGFATTFSLGGQTQLEGLFIALGFGGIGVALVVWAKHLLDSREATEEFEPFGEEEERSELVRTFKEEGEGVRRRRFLVKMLGGAAAALGAAAVFPVRGLGPSPGRELFETAWTAGARLFTETGEPVRAADLDVGGVVTVFPEGRLNAVSAQALLIRLVPEELDLPDDRSDWAPEGLVAFSKICTHAGCPVGLYDRARNELFCPCHQAVYDVPSGAVPIGGPAARRLPQLPIGIDDDGFLVARGDFAEPVGPSFWHRDR